MKPVSHAERIAKRHGRVVAARSVVTPAPAPGPISARSEKPSRSEETEAAGEGSQDTPGATRSDKAPRANPFAQFMGCAP